MVRRFLSWEGCKKGSGAVGTENSVSDVSGDGRAWLAFIAGSGCSINPPAALPHLPDSVNELPKHSVQSRGLVST